jgi:tetratricopeptide (TPR) repeat protein
MPKRTDQYRALTRTFLQPARWIHHGRGQWVAGSVVHGSVNQISGIQGDVIINDDRQLYLIDNFAVDRLALSVDHARARPSRLLQARYEVVTFVGREPELERLRSWRDSLKAVSILLVHGTGGQGKSRLALHFAQECVTAGWRTIAGRHASDSALLATGSDGPRSAGPVADDIAYAGGTLMVVDYAERWPLTDLRALISDAARQGDHQVRVLLLARPAGTWWDGLRYCIEDEIGLDAVSMPLPPLADQVDRTAMFRTACKQFAEALGVPVMPDVHAPAGLDKDDDSGLVLTTHMAALAAVDACSYGGAPPGELAEVSSYLLRRERDRWRHLYEQGQIKVHPDVIAQTVYTASLVGPLGYEEAVSAISQIHIGSSENPDRIIKEHAASYLPPEENNKDDKVLHPLYPDRLAEDFLALTAPGHSISYAPDPWAVEAPARLLSFGQDGEPPSWLRRALVTLIETAYRWPHVAITQLYPLLAHNPRLVLYATGNALATLAGLPSLELALLERIETELPVHQHVELDVGIAAIAAELAKRRLAVTTDAIARARIYCALGNRLCMTSHHELAVNAIIEAITIYNRFGKVNSTADNREAAIALSNLGLSLSTLGEYRTAVSASRIAIALIRRLSEEDSAKYQSMLSAPLTNLGNALSKLGSHHDALEATTEAITLLRNAIKDPTTHGPLTVALIALGEQLEEAGRIDDAIKAIDEAVAVRRTFANTAANRDSLASALTSLSVILAKVDRNEDATEMIAEAAIIYLELSETHPDRYDHALLETLAYFSDQLATVGLNEDSVAMSDGAIVICRQLIDANPIVYQARLAKLLRNRAVGLAVLGRQGEAVAANGEAVAVYRHLAYTNPAVYEPELARTLGQFSSDLLALGLHSDALSAADEAVGIRRRLSNADPRTHESDLAISLTNLGVTLANLGEHERALTVTNEAVTIWRSLADENPGDYQFQLAAALHNLCRWLPALECHVDALAAAEESAKILRHLYRLSPAAFAEYLREGLAALAEILDSLDRLEESAVINRELGSLSSARDGDLP